MRNFTKEMLVAGMVVVRRDGSVKVVANADNAGVPTKVIIDNAGTHKYMRLDRFNDDLTHVSKDKYDIIQVFSLVSVDSADMAAEADTSTRELLWTEEEPVAVGAGVSVSASDVTVTIPASALESIASIINALGLGR